MAGKTPSDDEIYDASLAMQDALWALAEETGTADVIGVAVNARLDHVNTITSLDPVRIAEEFNRIQAVSSHLAHSEGAKSEFAQAEARLDGWRGDAKAALIGKMSNVLAHLDRMATDTNQIHHIVGAFYSLAVHSRNSLLLLCQETQAAAMREIQNQDKRDAKVAVAMGKDIVSAALSFDLKSPVTSSLDGIVQTTATFVDYLIEGNNAADVTENYLIAGNALERSFQEGLDVLHKRLWNLEGSLAETMQESEVYRPISNHADIMSPDFRYENFAASSTVPNVGFEGSVGRERERVAAERRASESEINRRLGGAS